MLFLLLFSYPALEQWKSLVGLICGCERILVQGPDSVPVTAAAAAAGMSNKGSNKGSDVDSMQDGAFGALFIRALYEQLNFVPADFFGKSKLTA